MAPEPDGRGFTPTPKIDDGWTERRPEMNPPNQAPADRLQQEAWPRPGAPRTEEPPPGQKPPEQAPKSVGTDKTNAEGEIGKRKVGKVIEGGLSEEKAEACTEKLEEGLSSTKRNDAYQPSAFKTLSMLLQGGEKGRELMEALANPEKLSRNELARIEYCMNEMLKQLGLKVTLKRTDDGSVKLDIDPDPNHPVKGNNCRLHINYDPKTRNLKVESSGKPFGEYVQDGVEGLGKK